MNEATTATPGTTVAWVDQVHTLSLYTGTVTAVEGEFYRVDATTCETHKGVQTYTRPRPHVVHRSLVTVK